MSFPVSRRQVIKSFVLGAAFSNVIGKGWAETILHQLSADARLNAGVMRVNLADFPALNEPLGSVRIGTSAVSSGSHRQLGLFPPVIINRAADGALHVLSAACTHEGCVVRRVEPGSSRMVCPCHNSQFEPNGRFIAGPARTDLLTLPFQLSGSVLEIELEEVFYNIELKRVPSSSRVELSFIGFLHMTYEIQFLESPTASATPVPFARTTNGPLDQTELAGPDDFVSVFVERPGKAGIFQIVMKTEEV